MCIDKYVFSLRVIKRYCECVFLKAELGLDKAHRDALYSLPAEKKWQIYCSKKMVSLIQVNCCSRRLLPIHAAHSMLLVCVTAEQSGTLGSGVVEITLQTVVQDCVHVVFSQLNMVLCVSV